MAHQFVLLVDDKADALDWMTLSFDGAGIAVRTAMSVDQAIDILHSPSLPSLIVADLVMLSRTGGDFLRLLRADTLLGAVPVMILSAAPDPGEAGRMADAVLRKPVNPAALIDAAKNLLRAAPVYV